MTCFLDPRTDIVFERIFVEHPDILENNRKELAKAQELRYASNTHFPHSV